MQLVNLTPHEINEVTTNLVIPSSGTARVAQNTTKVNELDGIPVYRTNFDPSTIEGLPAPRKGVVYIVSALVLNAIGDRTDCVAPGNAVRDIDGKVVGCRGFRTT